MAEAESGTAPTETPRTPEWGEQVTRDVEWELDRWLESVPSPGHDQSQYGSEAIRQAAILISSRQVLARRAGEAGMTTSEYKAYKEAHGVYPEATDSNAGADPS